MAKIVCLFVLVALMQVAYGLQCYSCGEATGNTPCPADITKAQTVPCGQTVPTGQVGACLKQVATVNGKETTTRKCVITPKTDGKLSYNCPTGANCAVCESDLCNSASGVRFSFVTLLGVAAVFLIPKFM